MDKTEIPLGGGNTNASVVRVGDTVRRVQSRSSKTVHRLLAHLQSKGFSRCPRFLGIDDRGREILTYIPGETGINPTIWTRDTSLAETATMLREYHDATVGFDPAEPTWTFIHADRARHEVICHNDFAPYNFVFDGDRPSAIIDFDLAGPGPRLWDVAYAAYWMTPLSFHADDMAPFSEADVANGCRRLKLFCSRYGFPADRALLDTVLLVLRHLADEDAAHDMLGKTAADRLRQSGHFDHWQHEADAFRRRLPEIRTQLT